MSNAEEITRKLIEAREEARSDRRKELGIDRVSKALKQFHPAEQMSAICAYQAALIIEIANSDKEVSKSVWQASWGLSASMLQNFLEGATEQKH